VSRERVPVAVVRVSRGGEPLPLPRYMSERASGMDLLADVDGDVILAPGERRLVPTGLTIAIPLGYEGQVRPRSGVAMRDGVTVLNAPGTIDSDYRGEVQVLLVNLGTSAVAVRRGDRIAQLVIAPVASAVWEEVATLPASVRGAGGFGSTDGREERK
jgi:dUTP pyrophosphatase